MKNKYLLIITLLSFYSCQANDKNKVQLDARFQHYKSFFKYDMVNHFPEKILYTPSSIFMDTSTLDNHIFFTLEEKWADKNSLVKFIDSLNKVSINKFNAKADSLFVINKFTNENNIFKQNKYPDNYLYVDTLNSRLPVPNFWYKGFNINNTNCNLDSTYTLFIIDAKSGVYWDEKYLTNSNQMPTNWSHGFSKGVAVSEINRVVVYWFAIW